MHGSGDETARKFFISRAGADAAIASEVGRILEDAGHRVILQQWDFANRSFTQQMQTALNACDAVIALLSPAYMNSEYTAAEWQAALAADPFNDKNRLIVLRVAECKPRGLPATMAHWDLVTVLGDARQLPVVVLDATREGFSRLASGPASAASCKSRQSVSTWKARRRFRAPSFAAMKR
jgi:hypothetical protein